MIAPDSHPPRQGAARKGSAETPPFAPGEAPASGKHAEFREEALPHIDAVYRFALRLTGKEEQADDLVQETFLRAFEKWDQYTLGTRCRSWLFAICRNAFLRRKRLWKRRDELLRENAPSAPSERGSWRRAFFERSAGDPEADFFDGHLDEGIVAAIEELPEEYRTTLVLSDIEGLAYREVADVMEVPVGTVKSRLHRARRRLRGELREYAEMVGIVETERGDGPSSVGAGSRVPGEPEAPAREQPEAAAMAA